MLTEGGAISGYCSIGAFDIATRPARTNRIEMTDDRIGRSIKKCVNMRRLLLGCGCVRGGCFCGRSAGGDDPDWLSRHGLHHSFDHDTIALGQSLLDHDVLVAVVITHDHRTHLGDVARVDHVYEMAVV